MDKNTNIRGHYLILGALRIKWRVGIGMRDIGQSSCIITGLNKTSETEVSVILKRLLEESRSHFHKH